MSSNKGIIQQTFENYDRIILPPCLSEGLRKRQREAYFAGASALFYALMMQLDEGAYETKRDMELMAALQAEVDAFGQELDLTYLTGGHA